MKLIQNLNTVLLSVYFGMQINKMLKDLNMPSQVVSNSKEDVLYLEQLMAKYGENWLDRFQLVRSRLSELRGSNVTVMEALQWIKEKMEMDPILKFDGDLPNI